MLGLGVELCLLVSGLDDLFIGHVFSDSNVFHVNCYLQIIPSRSISGVGRSVCILMVMLASTVGAHVSLIGLDREAGAFIRWITRVRILEENKGQAVISLRPGIRHQAQTPVSGTLRCV